MLQTGGEAGQGSSGVGALTWGGGLQLDEEWGSQGPEDSGLQHSHPYPKSLGKMLQDSGVRKHVGTYVHTNVLAKVCDCHPGRGQEERQISS